MHVLGSVAARAWLSMYVPGSVDVCTGPCWMYVRGPVDVRAVGAFARVHVTYKHVRYDVTSLMVPQNTQRSEEGTPNIAIQICSRSGRCEVVLT